MALFLAAMHAREANITCDDYDSVEKDKKKFSNRDSV